MELNHFFYRALLTDTLQEEWTKLYTKEGSWRQVDYLYPDKVYDLTLTAYRTGSESLLKNYSYLKLSYYYPDYVSLKKIFPEEQTSSNQMMKKHLLHYVKEQHLLEKYLDKGEQHCSAMASFNLAEWKLAAHYCLSQATKIWADPNTMREWEKAMTLQYTEVDNKYQDVMMNAVIRAKVQAPQQ